MLDKKNHIDPSKNECCGCTACFSKCPQKAIKMIDDKEGFKYPIVDPAKCVECGICLQTCDFRKATHIHCSETPLKAYAIKNLNDQVRSESRSGGAFSALTDVIIEKNGCVFGAVLDDNFTVRHVMSENIQERNKLRGSKYVQSDLGNIFENVRNELKKGRIVGFSGTGCQIAGLKSYLGKDYENLYTFDIVCHGVPSPKVWKDYVEFLNKKGKLTDFNFRDKAILGWDMHIESYKINGVKKISRNYAKLFSSDNILRESCFECKYANLKRSGDFTLADFWGIDKHYKSFNDNKGVSLLLVNSQKGINLLKSIQMEDNFDYIDCSTIAFENRQLHCPTSKPLTYEDFWKDYNSKDFEFILKKYSDGKIINMLKTYKSIIVTRMKRSKYTK